jgi:hypothetical protein
MKTRLIALTVVALIAVLHVTSTPALSKEYVVMISRNINLRTGPDTGSFIIGRAWKGDIFELVGEAGNWFEIEMFSGDSRFVSKSWAAKLTESSLLPAHRMSLPLADDTLRSLHRDITHARERAAREADEIIPASVDQRSHEDFRRILEDRHVLEVMAMYSVQPALYADLANAVAKRD